MTLGSTRPLGHTGFAATRLGIGDLADRAVPLERHVATLRRALAEGLNVVDTAPNYEDGYSEEIVGRALAGHPRDSVFLIDKIDHPLQELTPQIEASLARLQLPYVDLFVFHAVSEIATWEAIVAQGGPMEALGASIRQGRARFRGVSSHHPEVLRRAVLSGLCDVVMVPIGPFVDPRYEHEILPLARAHGVGTVSFKTFGAGKLLADTTGYQRPLDGRDQDSVRRNTLPRLSIEDCLTYTLARDPDVALMGLSSTSEQDEVFPIAREVLTRARPSDEALVDIRRRAEAAVRDKGPCWWNPSA